MYKVGDRVCNNSRGWGDGLWAIGTRNLDEDMLPREIGVKYKKCTVKKKRSRTEVNKVNSYQLIQNESRGYPAPLKCLSPQKPRRGQP